ncbi:MAG: tetratricopeptide repeat protein, partial [Acidobacteria bacterium]|nr:tetratricopeptide repeat protein [Acidobacteriota bacterium]
LELRSAISVTMQVADALAAAHARGVIHRDIKAGNVMVTKNGTATYAAPEQATGAHVDHRADIFSTGVLLYEMLAGIWPFQGKTNVEVRYAVLHDTPVPIAELRPQDAPPRLQEILDRALAKDPKDRYQRIAEMRDDLRAVKRELTAGGVSQPDTTDEFEPVAPRHQTGSTSFGRTFRRWLRNITGAETSSTAQSTSAPPSSRNISAARNASDNETQHTTNVSEGGQKSIAILPFRNLSGDKEVSFYEFSLADAVITELARLRSLVVRPSSLIVKYQGQDRDPREIGEELSVGAVLAASFLRAGDKLRVNAQLLDVASGDLLWTDRIDATADDIIAVQDTIAQRIVEGLRVELSADERNDLAQRSTANPEAYNIYLRGRDAMGRYIYHTLANEDVEEAIEHFKRAIELDPEFALAHCALGGCYANRVIKSMGDFEDYERAEEAFRKGLDIDPKIMEARMHMVFIYLARGEKSKARAAVENLRHEAPNDVGVQFVASYLYRLDGDYERSLRSLDRMLSLNPAERVVVSYNRARVLMYQGRMDEAMRELDEGAQIEPDHPFIRTFRAVALYRNGQPAEAADILRGVLDTHPEMDGIRPHYAITLSKLGQHEAARAQLTERVKEVAEADHDAPYWIATAYAVEGMADQAFKWLERAINRGNENLPWFRANPEWAALRNDPRFEMLMQRIEKSHAQARVGVE